MWQRFTESARKVVYYAQEDAMQQGLYDVTPSHLLSGLFRESDTVAAHILASLAIDTEKVRVQEIASTWPPTPQKLVVPVIEVERMQLAENSKRVIDAAYSEAQQLSNAYIGTEHLLLGLIHSSGDAGRFLPHSGVTREKVRADIAQRHGLNLQSIPKTQNLWQRLFRKQTHI